MITRKASAVWKGTLEGGNGHVKLGSGAFEGNYGFTSRFGDGSGGTNPEELIGAAHAGCFSMALSFILEQAGFPVEEVATTAAVKMDKIGDGFKIVHIKLTTKAKVPGIDAATFLEHANAAKTGCPVSQALASVEISLDATLVA